MCHKCHRGALIFEITGIFKTKKTPSSAQRPTSASSCRPTMSALIAPGANKPANITVGQLGLLNQSLQNALGKNNQYRQDNIQLEQELKATKEALREMQTKYDGKAAEAAETKEKLTTAEGSIAELKQKASDDAVLLEEMTKAKEDAEQEKERAIKGMTNAAESNRMASESKEKAEKLVEELKARMEEETKRDNTVEESIRQLSSENTALKEEKAGLEKEVERKEGVIEKLLGQKRGGKKKRKNNH